MEALSISRGHDVASGSVVAKHGGLMIYLQREFRYNVINFNVLSIGAMGMCILENISGPFG